ncbi:MAG: RNA-binding protein [Alphaproteobacteria bacterium]
MTALHHDPASAPPYAAVAPAVAADSLRRCIVSRESLPPERMIRFVVAPDGTVTPDLERRLPGRGLWLTARRDIVRTACRRGHFAKATRGAVVAAADLDDRVEHLLAARVLSLFGLARKAGQAVSGYEKVNVMVRRGPVGALVLAVDGSPDARAAMRRTAGAAPVVEVLTGDEIGSVFGRPNAVHAALAPGRLAHRFVAEAARLAGFRAPVRVGKSD